jgi:hypothetical protein
MRLLRIQQVFARNRSTYRGTGRIQLQSALRAGFRNAGARSKKRCQIGVDEWSVIDSCEIGRRLKARKNGVGDLASRNAFFAVARWNVARPVPDIRTVGTIFHTQKNRRMAMFVSPDLTGPENLHEIARLRPIKVIEVLSELQLVKETGRAGSVCVPSAPDAFAIVLISNNQPF